MGCICDIIKLKRSVKVVPENSTVAPVLTQEQKAVIKNTWHILQMNLATVGINTFICLFEAKPELQAAFKEFKGKDLKELRFTGLLRKHSLRVMATLDKYIIHLDDPSFTMKALTELGKRHAKYKVPTEYVESILPPFLSTIQPYIEDFWNKDLEEAWETFFTLILFYMKKGMQMHKKQENG